MKIKGKYIIALAAALFLFGFLVFILVNEEWRRDLFVQRLTIPILAICSAVIIYGLFPAPATVRYRQPIAGPGLIAADVDHTTAPQQAPSLNVRLAGAGALLVIFAVLYNYVLFPKDVTVAGNIYYKVAKPAEDGLTPVPGAEVIIPENNMKSAPTDQQGRFTIASISFYPKSLDVFYANKTYNTKVSPDHKYPVIPQPAATPTPVPIVISANEWSEDTKQPCPPATAGARFRTKRFVLQHNFQRQPGDKTLYVILALQGDLDRFTSAQEIEPGTGLEIQQPDQAHNRKWEFKLTGDETKVKLSVCLTAAQPKVNPSSANLRAAYWFSK